MARTLVHDGIVFFLVRPNPFHDRMKRVPELMPDGLQTLFGMSSPN